VEELQVLIVQIQLILYHIVQHIDRILGLLPVLYCCILPVSVQQPNIIIMANCAPK
jgi:hypothetical protein